MGSKISIDTNIHKYTDYDSNNLFAKKYNDDSVLSLTLQDGRVFNQSNIWYDKILNRKDCVFRYHTVNYFLNKYIISYSPTLYNHITNIYKTEYNLIDVNITTRLGWEYCINYLYYNYSDSNYDLIDILDLDVDEIVQIYIASDFLKITDLRDKIIIVLTCIIETSLETIYCNHHTDNKTMEQKILYLIEKLPNSYLFLQNLTDIQFIKVLLIYLYQIQYNGEIFISYIKSRFNITEDILIVKDFQYIFSNKQQEFDDYLSEQFRFNSTAYHNLLILYLILKFDKLKDAVRYFKNYVDPNQYLSINRLRILDDDQVESLIENISNNDQNI